MLLRNAVYYTSNINLKLNVKLHIPNVIFFLKYFDKIFQYVIIIIFSTIFVYIKGRFIIIHRLKDKGKATGWDLCYGSTRGIANLNKLFIYF